MNLRMAHQVQRLELNYCLTGSRFRRPYRTGSELDHPGFRVGDADAWARKAVRLWGRIVDRVDEKHERLVYVTDPDGIWPGSIGDSSLRRTAR